MQCIFYKECFSCQICIKIYYQDINNCSQVNRLKCLKGLGTQKENVLLLYMGKEFQASDLASKSQAPEQLKPVKSLLDK